MNNVNTENSRGLMEILDLDSETANKLKGIGINTVPQLLLGNLKNKGIKKKKLAEIYSKCRERITSFPKNPVLNDVFPPLNLNDEFSVGFKSGLRLLEEAKSQWNNNNNSGVDLGSDCLMDFFDGGLLLGEITEFFGQDLSAIRRTVHWMISKTMFNSFNPDEEYEKNERNSCCNVLYIQTTNNSFDPIYIKKCFEKLSGENECDTNTNSQFTQNTPKLSRNVQYFLSNINVVTVSDYSQLTNLLYNMQSIKNNELCNLKFIVIDSITAIIGTHTFIVNQDPSLPTNKYFKDMKDVIFIIGKLLRYTCKVLNISCVVTALVKQNPKTNAWSGIPNLANGNSSTNDNISTYSSLNQKLLSNVKCPTTVTFTEGNYSFPIPPPTNVSATEIDQSWTQFPHNRVLIENIHNINANEAGFSRNCMHASFPHIAKVLRWTIYKSNRISIGKYVCVIQEKVGIFESNCQFT
ncbi:hypothetical protein FG379_002358 [Cryptosporidium bovis]|uniref:uncharacterized protein n=1 Tax=Cryptosporidium bovis TaxID=310047 RepID=UPI00351A4398|nr:hypothetical protein FG379_002358 [Cryptosporidium bovis]